MQLLAKDREKKIVHADYAYKNLNYKCLECKGMVRLRGGLHRRKHFYHLFPNKTCHLSGKSLVHLQTQCQIQKLLPQGEVFLERRFEEINRIADVCWEKEKIIFEVQCSFITSEEIHNRNCDYKSLGYKVIWILHDSRYNSDKITEAEIYLQNVSHYYTDVDISGEGGIYDQISWLESPTKRKKGERSFIEIGQFNHIVEPKMKIEGLRLREKKWEIYFYGDFLDSGYKGILTDLQKKQLEKVSYGKEKSQLPFLFKLIWEKLKEGYQNFLNILIENACR